MRADRLLSLVLLLRHRGRMSASALARELDVSTRTVLRDVDALSAAGIPVYAERGRAGGFALLPGFSTDLTGLTHDEALALLTAGSRATSEALGMAPALASAMRKVVDSMPTAQRVRATGAAERVLVRRGGLLREPAPDEHLGVVQHALFAGRRLRLRYASRGEAPRWRTVDPVGLVHADGRWYLLAGHDGADRTYRVSRIRDAGELDEPARRAAEIDLAAVWQRRRAAFRAGLTPFPVAVRVRAQRRRDLVRTAVELRSEAPDRGGWLRLELTFGAQRHAVAALWALGADVEVMAPASVRSVIAERAAATVARYPAEPA